MAAALWKSRVFTGFGSAGFGGKTDDKALESSLKRATHSEKVDVEKDALLAITQSSHNEQDRRTIMRHLAVSLSDDSSSKWRVIIASLTIVEHLLQHGNPDLVLETAGGMHFDLSQRLSFLDKFEYSYDKRVESLIRRRALSLRGLFAEKQAQAIANEEIVKRKLQKQKKAFHAEDTDDDLSDAEMQPSKVLASNCDNLLDATTTDGESIGEESCGSDGPSQHSSPNSTGLDLLAMNESPTIAATRRHAQDMDLLDLPAAAAESSLGTGLDLLQVEQEPASLDLLLDLPATAAQSSLGTSVDLLQVEQGSPSLDLL